MTAGQGTRRTQWAAGSAVALALLFAGVATVATARGDTTDGKQPRAASTAVRAPATDSADAGFARDMAVHHQQAVEMSFIVRDRTQDEEVRRFAYDIANTQANQRGMLLGWLDLWELPKVAAAGQEPMAWMAAHGGRGGDGHDMAGMDGMDGMTAGSGSGFTAHDGALMPGMATRTELDRLRKADGKQAEILYLQLMTDHHKGGVAMARGCAGLCTVKAERRLAKGMVEAQRSELDAMAQMLAARGAEPR
ncbi:MULTISPECIES: DUF305 domain-containing protein [Streptomyces]|uniref:DUF305 domain-containing protein n=1 Tax=unclassified Streptomyces TaxID=2593676 RepID=UPI00088849EA|nr:MULTISPECIES: DUF305 domain-containing protein [unclassified Streptomyces]MDX2727755.1 DUF305 domain-containing protein [Streptomyces sp. PA03-2a]SCY88809.1 Uncharacterized conserved protein, DUF305 family [Streptomyces sp. 136MFCol5.1]SFS72022.1 Uncharacterized conserved protein, DUF305 family [Streptomyces sp. ok210]